MTDIQKLKVLAEAAPVGPWYPPDEGSHSGMVFDCDLGSLLSYESIETERDACVAYVAAANPAAVLDLIEEIEQLQDDLVTFKGGISALGEACKKLTFCARTVTDGPDEALMAACEAAENTLSLVGVSRAIDYIEGLKAENTDLHATLQAAKGEIERLKASNIDQGKQIQWLGEYNTQRHVELSSENVQVIRQRLDAEKERDQLKAENEALRSALTDVMTQVDGNIRETVRDCVNGRDDVQDIYGYCDAIESIIDAAMSNEATHD